MSVRKISLFVILLYASFAHFADKNRTKFPEKPDACLTQSSEIFHLVTKALYFGV
jgi:hypothetical protein